MPLVRKGAPSADAVRAVSRVNASASVRAGLFLYLGCWGDAHHTADSVEHRDGYLWHAIVHRQEPDAWNSGYWFRKTGSHPIFTALAKTAGSTGYSAGCNWDPYRFTDFCGSARPHSEEERIAMDVQLLEWQLLFDFCARDEHR